MFPTFYFLIHWSQGGGSLLIILENLPKQKVQTYILERGKQEERKERKEEGREEKQREKEKEREEGEVSGERLLLVYMDHY